MILRSFDAWREHRVNYLMQNNEQVPCPECNGSGEVSCHACGEWSICHECDGEGATWSMELNADEIRRGLNVGMYARQIMQEVDALARYTGEDPVTIFVENGVTAASHIATRALYIVNPLAIGCEQRNTQ